MPPWLVQPARADRRLRRSREAPATPRRVGAASRPEAQRRALAALRQASAAVRDGAYLLLRADRCCTARWVGKQFARPSGLIDTNQWIRHWSSEGLSLLGKALAASSDHSIYVPQSVNLGVFLVDLRRRRRIGMALCVLLQRPNRLVARTSRPSLAWLMMPSASQACRCPRSM